ncbi:hypothetical protein AGMMS49982_08870 [Bacteroidia bacterium]|nr:hypothetical protein AGMMS49982_08870 [Bacteroidia bacterium]
MLSAFADKRGVRQVVRKSANETYPDTYGYPAMWKVLTISYADKRIDAADKSESHFDVEYGRPSVF